MITLMTGNQGAGGAKRVLARLTLGFMLISPSPLSNLLLLNLL